jgi:hypothetical protein
VRRAVPGLVASLARQNPPASRRLPLQAGLNPAPLGNAFGPARITPSATRVGEPNQQLYSGDAVMLGTFRAVAVALVVLGGFGLLDETGFGANAPGSPPLAAGTLAASAGTALAGWRWLRRPRRRPGW